MCLATITAIAAVTGAAATAAGAVSSGIAQGQAAQYQGQVAANNAKTAQQNAAHAAQASAVQTEQAGLKARAQNDAAKVSLAANGLDVTSGSPVDVLKSQRELGALDTETVANRGAEAVYGYATQATGYQAQANLDNAEAPYDYAGGALKAVSVLANPSVTSLLHGAPTVPDQYAWMTGRDSNDLDAAEAGGL